MNNLAERVCLVVEMLVSDDDRPKGCSAEKQSTIYRFAHVASGRCPHPEWLREFEEAEAAMIKGNVIPDIREHGWNGYAEPGAARRIA